MRTGNNEVWRCMSARLRTTIAAVLMPATVLGAAVPAVAATAHARPATRVPNVRVMTPTATPTAEPTPNRPAAFKPTAATTPVVHKTVKKKAATRTVVVSRYRSMPARIARLNWHALAACEGGGRPGAVSSNGRYRGMYQFSVGTWRSVGGRGLPNKASKLEQTYRAQLLYMRRGASPWPVCGRRLFT